MAVPYVLPAPDAGSPRLGEATPLAARLFPPPGELPRRNLGREPLPPILRPDARLGVLDITEFFGETSGGIRTYLLEKANYVEARAHYRQTIVIPGVKDAITGTDGVRCYRIRGPKVPGQPPYRFMLATRSNRRIFLNERPSIVEVGSPGFVPWISRLAKRSASTPLSYFFHSNFPRIFCPFPERRPWLKPIDAVLWRYAKFIDRFFEVTLVSSDFAAEGLRKAGVDRIERVPLGVDVDHFNPVRRARREETRRRLGVGDEPLLAFCGRFGKDKELELVVEAWPEISRRTGATFLFVGDGPLKGWLEEKTRDMRVRVLPYVQRREDLADLMAALDVYVAPSAMETFGLAATEALSTGTPVVASNRGGAGETVVAANAGAVFEAGVASSLAERTTWLLGQDLRPFGRRARAYVEAHHRWDAVFDRLFALYERLTR